MKHPVGEKHHRNQQHLQETTSTQVYGLALSSSSSIGGTASMSYMLTLEQQKARRFLKMPLLNGWTPAGIPLQLKISHDLLISTTLRWAQQSHSGMEALSFLPQVQNPPSFHRLIGSLIC